MNTKKLRRWNTAIHRDLGYFFFGMTIIYALSGIILNHFKSGDFEHPDYSKTYNELKLNIPANAQISKEFALSLLSQIDAKDRYKSHILSDNDLRIFLNNGVLTVNLESGNAIREIRSERYVIREFNFLHYNNIKKFFTWYSDLYAIGLILLAISGLFILKGKNGILRRGAWLTAIGIIIPAIFILVYV